MYRAMEDEDGEDALSAYQRSSRVGVVDANRDYGELTDEYGASRLARRWESGNSAVEEEAMGRKESIGTKLEKSAAVGAAKAKEISANISAGASKWFASTKEWIREKSEPQPGRQALLSAQQPPSLEEHASNTVLVQAQASIPLCAGNVVNEPIQPRTLYRSLAARIPPNVGPGDEFVVVLPTGEVRVAVVPMSGLDSGQLVTIPYNGFIRDSFGEVYRDLSNDDDYGGGDSSIPVRANPEERLLELYRLHNPEERDALLERGAHGFGLKVYDGKFGVHVHHAVYPGSVPSMLAPDDVVVAVNDAPVQSLSEFHQAVESTAPAEGDFISLRLLRPSPPPLQRCPADHVLRPVGPMDPIPMGSECCRCHGRLWDSRQVHRCAECDWALCDSCFQSGYANLNSGKNANNGAPAWAQDYEEAFGDKLSFSSYDRGAKLRIFWDTTGEWWLGEVVSFQPGQGHEILYEETGAGPQPVYSKQLIRDISKRTYRLLRPGRASQSAEEPIDWLAPAQPQPTPREQLLDGEDSFVLTEDEKALLDDAHADLATL